jgi:hypothetical protein
MKKTCQPFVDAKAFKGNGDAWALLASVKGDLGEVWREMEVLARESSKLSPSSAYMQVHRFRGLTASTGAVKELRWRMRGRTVDNHVCWPDVEALTLKQSIVMRRYFWQLNQRMLDLNCLAAMLRSAAMRLLGRMTDSSDPDCAAMFVAWIAGNVSLADFDMRRPDFHSEDT